MKTVLSSKVFIITTIITPGVSNAKRYERVEFIVTSMGILRSEWEEFASS
jgi:hypothetical protein